MDTTIPREHIGWAKGEIALGPLREAFLRSGMTTRGVARAAGKDEATVAHLLGTRPHFTSYTMADGTRKRYESRRLSCTYETALWLSRALGLDPVDVGL